MHCYIGQQYILQAKAVYKQEYISECVVNAPKLRHIQHFWVSQVVACPESAVPTMLKNAV